jgi:hypothetical protein
MRHSADGDDVVIVSPSLSVSILGDASLASPREDAAQERDEGGHSTPPSPPRDAPQAPVPRQSQSGGHRAVAAADVTPPRGVKTVRSLNKGSKHAPFVPASLMPLADKQVGGGAQNLEHSEGGMLHVVVSSVALGGGTGGLRRGGGGRLLIDCVVPCPARSDAPEALGESGHGQVCVRVPGEGELGAQDLAEGRALQVDGTMRFPMDRVQSSCLKSGDAAWPRGSEIQFRYGLSQNRLGVEHSDARMQSEILRILFHSWSLVESVLARSNLFNSMLASARTGAFAMALTVHDSQCKKPRNPQNHPHNIRQLTKKHFFYPKGYEGDSTAELW